MIDFATSIVDDIGLLGAAFLIALESIVLPLPSEVVLLLTGFNVSANNFDLLPAILATTSGSILGAWVLYSLGLAFSKERIYGLNQQFGKYLGIKNTDLDRAFRWFDRHGALVVFFGRLLPVLRSLVSVPAGINRMSIIKFTTLTAAGSAIWNSIWIWVGVSLGAQWLRAEKWATVLDLIVYVLVVVLVLIVFLRIIKRINQQPK
jgi:membrane protein DedA with SNARE-associated domain